MLWGRIDPHRGSLGIYGYNEGRASGPTCVMPQQLLS